MKKLLGYIGIVLAAAIMLPCLAIGALALYDAPAEVRNMLCLICAGLFALVLGALLILGKGKRK